jgi:hypothetical protein
LQTSAEQVGAETATIAIEPSGALDVVGRYSFDARLFHFLLSAKTKAAQNQAASRQ